MTSEHSEATKQLWAAVLDNDTTRVQHLLQHHAGEIDLEARHGANGNMALQCAAYRGQLELLETLLLAGANPNSVNGSSCTGLYWGCYGGNPQVVSLMIEYGADVDQVTQNGTVLEVAMRRGTSGHGECAALCRNPPCALIYRGDFCTRS